MTAPDLMFRLTIHGEPVPWQSFQRGGKSRNRFTSQWEDQPGYEKLKTWQAQIQLRLRRAWGNKEPLSGPIVLDRWFYLPWPDLAPQRDPRAIYKWYWKHLAMKPDLDNLAKAFSDACEGILFHGDQQIVGGEPRKDIARPDIYKNPKEGWTDIRFHPWEKA
ncbi:RusA family crossover junction endodeoxyribonuclease [candidate division KSB1 bacterium]|nr:RusA family crossover junction endodeoxyribonuclease [candidate division KSB1 bacterium]